VATPDLFTIDQEPSPSRDVRAVLEALGSAKASELAEATGYSRPTVLSQIDDLVREGVVAAEGKPRSPQRRYRWTGRRP
jgi:predicted ArsR family transcriptional regulator